MTEVQVQEIINEVFPKIEKHYGWSKFHDYTPYVETHYNIYEKYSGESGAEGEQDKCHAEYCNMMNEISVYWPQMKSRKMVIETLIHEYQHYLQSPSWFKRYYNMGFEYHNHPYELQATEREQDYKLFI